MGYDDDDVMGTVMVEWVAAEGIVTIVPLNLWLNNGNGY